VHASDEAEKAVKKALDVRGTNRAHQVLFCVMGRTGERNGSS